MHVTFYVANKDHKGFDVLLGRSWMTLTSCQINLTTRSYKLEVNSVHLTGKSAEIEDRPKPNNSTSPQVKATELATTSKTHEARREAITWIQDVDHPQKAWKVSTASLRSQGYGRGESQPLQCWLPKAAYQQLPATLLKTNTTNTSNRQSRQQNKNYTMRWLPKNRRKAAMQPLCPQPKLSSHHSNLKKRWIPKDTLKAQGYYEGNHQIWIPKSPSKLPRTPPTTYISATQTTKFSSSPSIPKPIAQRTQYKWIVRADHNKKKYKAATEESIAHNQPLQIKDTPTSSEHSTIQARALLLQQLPNFIKKCQSRALACQKALQG